MRALAVVRFLAVFSTGLIGGILLGDRMGASFARPALSPSGFVRFQQIQHVHFARMMPILIGVAILSSVAWLVVIRARVRTASFVCLAVGTLAFIVVALLTRTINMPINNQLMTWSAASPPPDVMGIWMRWERAHTVRTFIAVFGFALELVAFGASQKIAEA